MLMNNSNPFGNFSTQMNNHFNSIQNNMNNLSKLSGKNSNNYEFSKQTVIGNDNKIYTTTNIKTNQIKNGKKKSFNKRIYKKNNNKVQIITHPDGRRQIIGDKSIIDDFPKHMKLKQNKSIKNGK